MINYYVTYHCGSSENRDQFYAEIQTLEVAEKSCAEDGCIRYSYYYPANCSSDLFLWEQWESLDAQKAHTAQPHFLQLGSLKEKYSITTEILIEEAASK